MQNLYVDGVLRGTTSWTGTIFDSDTAFSIGRLGSFGGLFFDGSIDDVGLWNDALSEGEALAVFNLADDPQLRIDLGQADQLFQLHDDGSGSLVLAGLTWGYATGLAAYPLGVPTRDMGGNVFLRLDDLGTGLAGLVPEPASVTLMGLSGLGLLSVVRRRKKKCS